MRHGTSCQRLTASLTSLFRSKPCGCEQGNVFIADQQAEDTSIRTLLEIGRSDKRVQVLDL